MDRRAVLAAGVALAAAPAAALADAKPPIRLSKVFGFLDKYLAIPPAERSRFVLAYTFMLDGKPAPGLKAAIVEADGRRTPLQIGPDARALRLPTAAQLASASFVADAPAGAKLGVKLDLEPLLTPAQEFPVRELDLALAQANAGMAKAGGLIAFALPKLSGVSFLGSGSGRARLAGGGELALPMAEGAPFYDPKLVRGAATILLARAPQRLAFKSK